jgi:hypothetical protein
LLLFGKGFDGDHLVVPQSFSQIHGGKGALANFLFGLEEFVEVALVDFLFELLHP